MSEKTPPSAEEQQEEARYKAACDALLAPYKGRYYAERPPDPRVLDTGRLRSIRGRLMDYYYYSWREKEANGELLEALYGGIKGSTGSYVTISTDMVYVNDDGTDVGFYYRREYRDYQKCFHMTLSGLRMRNFITNYDDARALKGSLLPDWGVTVRDWPAGISVRLEKEERHEEWVTGGSVPLLIVVATLDYLIKHPEEAQPWRSI